MRHAPSFSPSLVRRRAVLAIPLLGGGWWASGAQGRSTLGTLKRTSQQLMGTQVDIVAEGPDSNHLSHAIDSAYTQMHRLEALMSRYNPRSIVSRINLAAGIASVKVPTEVMDVLQEAQRISTLSGGAFDATVGGLKVWDFGSGVQGMPRAGEIARQLAYVDAHALVLNPKAGTAFLARQGMALDLGGIAKLPILEAGMRTLQAQGVEHAMINGGGDVLVQGMLQGRPWRVGLRDPRSPAKLLGVVQVSGAAVVASSGDYERYFFHQGQRFHHILSPRTGLPTLGVHGVSLIARNVAEVNGLGAAMMVLGAQAGRQLAEGLPQVATLMAGQNGQIWQSAAMKKQLQPAVPVPIG